MDRTSKIRVMPDSLASQVAAGEVVESPSSIVKELIENSIDAGAKNINIIIERGGKFLIKVIDDGSGMSREDAILSIERHATSKIKSKNDLHNISTFGFRGEALPSIASVSNFKLTTSSKNNPVGTELLIKGGKLIAVNECGSKPGTQIEVRALFYNIPARKKFLKSDSAEFSKIERAVIAACLSAPHIGFSLHHGTKCVLNLGQATSYKNRILDVFGSEFSEKLIEFSTDDVDGIKLKGFVSNPDYNFTTRKHQYVFINSRAVKNSSVSISVRDAFKGLIEKGMNPVVILFINVKPNQIDVNIHPSKEEVKFDNSNKVQRVISETIISSISSDLKSNNNSHDELADLSKSKNESDEFVELKQIHDKSVQLIQNNMLDLELSTSQEIEPSLEKEFKVLGLLRNRFVLIENDEGLMIMNKRAAHERVLYEEITLNQKDDINVPIQRLLVPLTIDIHRDEYEMLFNFETAFHNLGFMFEGFGGNTIKLEGVPYFFKSENIEEYFKGILVDLVENGLSSAKDASHEVLISSLVNLTSRYFELNSIQELEMLLKKLLQCKMPYVDARGRPTLYQLSYKDIEKKLGVR